MSANKTVYIAISSDILHKGHLNIIDAAAKLGDVTRFAIAKPEPLRVEHENFRDAVLGKEADIVTLDQGARVVEVCEAMIESANTNRFVTITAG